VLCGTHQYRWAYTRPSPLDPPPNVQPKPIGIVRLPRFLLIKPDCTCYEILDSLLCKGKTLRAYVITKDVISLLYPSNNCLIRVLFQLQLIECLIKHLDCLFKLPPCLCKYQYVIHIPYVLNIKPFHLSVQIQKIKSTKKRRE